MLAHSQLSLPSLGALGQQLSCVSLHIWDKSIAALLFMKIQDGSDYFQIPRRILTKHPAVLLTPGQLSVLTLCVTRVSTG